MSEDPQLPPEPANDWRAGRRAEKAARREERRSRWGGAPVGAIVLILIGALLLAENFGLRLPERWWALFLLIPATGAVVAAIRHCTIARYDTPAMPTRPVDHDWLAAHSMRS